MKQQSDNNTGLPSRIPENIEIFEELYTIPSEFVRDILLDNLVVLHCRNNGTALGNDGREYCIVCRDDAEGDCEILGYSPDISAPIDDTHPERFL